MGIACGSQATCDPTSESVCCLGPMTCTKKDECVTGATAECDDDADCTDTKKCCYDGTRTACSDSCKGGDVPVCSATQKCPPAMPFCIPFSPTIGACSQ